MNHGLPRAERLFALVTTLDSRRGKRPAELARDLGVHRSTIHRDLLALQGLGIGIVSGPEGYRLLRGAYAPPLQFTVSEIIALRLAATAPPVNSDTPFAPALKRALAKIETLGSKQTGAVSARMEGRMRVELQSSAQYGPVRKLFVALERALLNQRRVAVEYQALADSTPQPRTLDPYALFFRRHGWYLAAFCYEADKVLTFKLVRFHSVEPTGDRFHYPDDFSLEDYLAPTWELIHGDTTFVRVRFAPRLAPILREQQRHPTQQLEDQPDGSILLTVEANPEELSWWVLGFGPEAEVLEPPELRQRMKDVAAALLEVYRGA